MGVFKWMDLTLCTEWIPGADPARRIGLENPLTLTGKFGLFEETPRRPAMALQAGWTVIDGSVDLHSQFIAGKEFRGLEVSVAAGLQMGFEYDPGQRRAITLGAGVQRYYRDSLLMLDATGRVDAGGRGSLAAGPMVTYPLLGDLDLAFGIQVGVGSHTPLVRFLFGLVHSTEAERDRDRDGDGIPDRQDKCPDAREDEDGYEEEDGCPEGGRPKPANVRGPRSFTTPRPLFRLRIPQLQPIQVPAGPAGPTGEDQVRTPKPAAPASESAPTPPAQGVSESAPPQTGTR